MHRNSRWKVQQRYKGEIKIENFVAIECFARRAGSPIPECLLLAQSGHSKSASRCPLSGGKRTSKFKSVTSAFDAVDGAHSAASKCNTELKRRWAIQGGEVTADSGTDDIELKALTDWRGHDDVMQTRSFRGLGEPAWVIASLNACLRLGPDPRGALWPAATPTAQTGRTHDRTPPMLQKRQKVLARAPSTHDP
jgi:hypothetical protein